MTLVELLVVIAVIGMLLMLLMPALQAAREAGRRAKCTNNIRQLAVALHSHHDTHKHFPAGGWSYKWLPEPNAGSGKNQPGSWIYSILDELEESSLHDLGKGASGQERSKQIAQLVTTPLAVLNCPSRRPPALYTVSKPEAYRNLTSEVSTQLTASAKSDYAACASGGEPNKPPGTFDRGYPVDGPGPATLEEAAEWETPNPTTGRNRWQSEVSGAANGAIIARYPIAVRQITDGTSKTYLLGEKFIEIDHYDTGWSISDDQNAYVGFDRDNQVSSRYRPITDTSISEMVRIIEGAGEDYGFHFGSAHPRSFNAAMCDGSVHLVASDIDDAVHRAAGSRDEAEAAEMP